MTQTATTAKETEQPFAQTVWLMACLIVGIWDRASVKGRRMLAFWTLGDEADNFPHPEGFADRNTYIERLQTDRDVFAADILESIYTMTDIKIAPSSLHRFPEKTPAEIAEMFGNVMRALMTRDDCSYLLWSGLMDFFVDLDHEAQSHRTNAAKAYHVAPLLLVNLMANGEDEDAEGEPEIYQARMQPIYIAADKIVDAFAAIVEARDVMPESLRERACDILRDWVGDVDLELTGDALHDHLCNSLGNAVVNELLKKAA